MKQGNMAIFFFSLWLLFANLRTKLVLNHIQIAEHQVAPVFLFDTFYNRFSANQILFSLPYKSKARFYLYSFIHLFILRSSMKLSGGFGISIDNWTI